MSFGEASFPASPYAPEILALSWPSQSSTLWGGLAMEFETEVSRLRGLLNTQMDIIEVLMTMSGEFIKSAVRLGRLAEIALRDRIELYETAARLAHAGATEISMTKDDLTQIVKQADDAIKQAQEDAAKQEAAAMGNPIAIGVIEGALVGTIEGIVANAAAEAQLRDGEAAAKVGGYSMELAQLSSTGDMLGQGTTSEMGSGIPAAPAFNGGGVPASPAPQDGGGFKAQPASRYDEASEAGEDESSAVNQSQSSTTTPDGSKTGAQQGAKPAAWHNDAPTSATNAANSSSNNPLSQSLSSLGSMPGSASSGGASNPGSMVQSMMSPLTSSMNPGSAMNPASSMNPASAMNPASGGMPGAGGASPLGSAGAGSGGAGAGVGGLGQGASAAGAGAGLAESATRMGAGAVSAGANAVGAAASTGAEVAQGAVASSAAAASSAPASTSPAIAGGAGGAPMAMMGSAGTGGAAAGSGLPLASIPAPSNTPPSVAGTPNVQTGGAAGAGAAPGAVAGSPPAAMVMSKSPIKSVGGGGAGIEAMIGQAAAASARVVQALVAQTRGVGYMGLDWAVSLILERSGQVTGWLATNEGPSYIPFGVRVPADVRVAVADRAIGTQLWENSAGGGDPLEVLARHARLRLDGAPGSRVLALASSLPAQRVADWAGEIGAKPMRVDPTLVDPRDRSHVEGAGGLIHRCAAAMSWDWRQASAFDVEQRFQVAARHMHMAVSSGHLSGVAVEETMRLFEDHQPISDELWAGVRKEWNTAVYEYQHAMRMRGHGGGGDPVQAFMKARAAEVVMALRNYDTVDGCADILYATRLAGAPLNPAAAVA